MVETKVILCDLCKKQVANLKCSLCGKDLCSGNCSATYDIYFGAGSYAYLPLYLCHTDCDNKVIGFMKKIHSEDKQNKLYKDVRELFLDFVKKGLILENLKEEKK